MIFSMILVSCGDRSKSATESKPETVRELMESEGWEYCQLIETDVFFDKPDPWILESEKSPNQFDLFRKGSDYALVRPHSDNIKLTGYTDEEHFTASYWINHYATRGNYSIYGRTGNADAPNYKTKHYTGKCFKKGDGTVYFNFNSDLDSSTNEAAEINNSEVDNSQEADDGLDEQPTKYKDCPLCYGSTRCGGCGGSGQVYNSIDYSPGQYVDCSSCGGSGSCPMCEGTGIVEDLGW